MGLQGLRLPSTTFLPLKGSQGPAGAMADGRPQSLFFLTLPQPCGGSDTAAECQREARSVAAGLAPRLPSPPRLRSRVAPGSPGLPPCAFRPLLYLPGAFRQRQAQSGPWPPALKAKRQGPPGQASRADSEAGTGRQTPGSAANPARTGPPDAAPERPPRGGNTWELLLLHQDILTAPGPGIANQIWVVMAISFYKAGKLNACIEKYGAKAESAQRVTPEILQSCLSYSLTVRLAPTWNKAGHLLVQGKDFLSQAGKQNAVVLDISVTETHTCLSVEVYTVRLPPPELSDFGISQRVIKDFETNTNAVIEGHSILNKWCYVLPSMKMGQILSVFHTIPPDCPFHSFHDFQMHWDQLYGYKLPEDSRSSEVYCSIYFKMIGERTFTYPLSCVRSQPVQFFPRVDLEGVLKRFLSDLKLTLPHICGFPVRMTARPRYHTHELARPPAQENKARLPNLTTKGLFPPSRTQAPPTPAQAPPTRPAWAQTLPRGWAEAGRQVALSAGQQSPRVSWPPPAQPGSAQSRKRPLSSQAREHLEVEVPSRGNTPLQDTQSGSQSTVGPKFVPVFKNGLSSKRIFESGHQKRKSHVMKEPKLFSLHSSVSQCDKLKFDPTTKNKSNHNMQTSAGHLSRPSRSLPEKNAKSCESMAKHHPSNGKLSSGSKLLSSGSALPVSNADSGAMGSAAGSQVRASTRSKPKNSRVVPKAAVVRKKEMPTREESPDECAAPRFSRDQRRAWFP
ncbi:PREDICTED: uncharacterized protein C18orf63 homolog [Condylura cristata]|uniref:uncharacterized protein C18orf63 homolog n=1 Tax=Condylura cristata TaxID=143302 RepID=UPI00064357FC|nr:PREDICTED: uncharacterized protein C18orf63 homolog [Condylura cristata]